MEMIDALYHFDNNYHVKAIMRDGVEELLHKEVAGALNATIPGDSKPKPGELLGFLCIDGRFRLFVIDDVEYEDDTGQAICTALDAAVQELYETVIPGEVQPIDATVTDALSMWIEGTAWKIGNNTSNDVANHMRSYYQTMWEIFGNVMQTWNVRIVPYYTFTDGKISGRYIDIEPDVGKYQGRLVESGFDAGKVNISQTGVPVTALYGIGAQLETEDFSENAPHLTFADIVWSKASGDPADKPAGQDWIGDPEALAEYGRDGKHRFAVVEFEEIEDANQLITATWEHLQKIKMPKRSASGNLYDIEMIEGSKHAAIRAGDIIRLRAAKHPDDIEARITEISRNYIDESRTTFEIGDKEASAKADIDALTINARHTEKTIIIDRRRIKKTEDRIELHAKTIDLQGDIILANAVAIAANGEVIALHAERLLELTAGQENVMSQILLLEDELALRVTNERFVTELNLKADSSSLTTLKTDVEARFDEQGNLIAGHGTQIKANADAIALRAVKEDVDAKLQVLAGKITAKADATTVNNLSTKVSAAEADIDGLNALIKLKADAKTVDNLGTRVSAAEVAINGANAEIALKVNKDNVIAAINLSPETATIKAGKINLQGYVTADELAVKDYITSQRLATALGSAAYMYADKMVSKRGEFDVLYAENMFFTNQALGLYPDIQVCTRARAYSFNTTVIRYTDWDGTQKSTTVLTSADVSVAPAYRTISYLGYK